MGNEMALYSLKEDWASPLSVFASSPKEAMDALLREYEITSFQISFLKHLIPETGVLHVDCTTSIDLMTCDTDDEWLLSLRKKGLENYLNEVFESKYPDL